MKKSIVAVGVIAVLGLSYTGLSWYTGVMIKSNIDQKIDQVTQQINHKFSNHAIDISYSDYQQSVFSTKMHITVKLSPKTDQGTSDTPQTTLFDDDIIVHHGPFPLEALKQGQFSPQMAWVNYEMTRKASPELWALAGGKPFITGSLGISYKQYLSLKLMNYAINQYKKPDSSVMINLATGNLMTLHANKDWTDVAVNANLNGLQIQDIDESFAVKNLTLSAINNKDNDGFKYTFGIENLSLKQAGFISSQIDINNINSYGDLDKDYQFDTKITVDNITYNTTANSIIKTPLLVVNNFASTERLALDDQKKIKGDFTASVGSLAFGNQLLGNGDISITYQGIDHRLLSSSSMIADLAIPQETETEANQIDDIKIALNNFTWHNQAGDLKAKLDVGLMGKNINSTSDINAETINEFNMNVDIPFKLIAQLVAQVQNPQANEVTPKQLEKATNLVYMSAGLLLGNLAPAIEMTKDGIHSDVKFDKENNQVIANGSRFTKEQFFDHLLR